LKVGAAGDAQTTLGGKFANITPTAQPVATSDKIPDFTFKLNYAAPWGHIDGRLALSDDWVHSGQAFAHNTSSVSTLGWAAGVAGTWNVPFFAGDSFNAAFQYGEGATKYVEGSGPQEDVVIDGSGTIHALPAWSVQGNYVHNWWNSGGSNLRSNIAFSYLNFDFSRSWFGHNNFSQSNSFSSQIKDGWFGGVNLIWSPVPQVDLGIEYAYGRQELESNQRADSSAVNMVATFRF